MDPERPPFVVGLTRTIVHDSGSAAARFARCRAVACAGAIDPPFLSTLLRLCARARFESNDVKRLGHRSVERPPLAGAALTLALSRPGLLRWVEDVTGCGPLGSIEGRVVEMRAEPGDHLHWHDDLNNPNRRLAITVNLGEHAYEGGAFELRDARSCQVLLTHRHTCPGEALIFEVARGLEHRVLPVTSGGPRRVYAGWFLSAGAQSGARKE